MEKNTVVRARHARRRALADVGEDVPVRQHHAFGAARGARGEADRRQRGRRQILHDEVGRRRRRRQERLALAADRSARPVRSCSPRRVGPHDHDRRQRPRRGAAALREAGGDARVVDDEEPRPRMRDAPRHALGIVVEVERDHHEPHPERGEVERHPGTPLRTQTAMRSPRPSPRAGTRPASARPPSPLRPPSRPPARAPRSAGTARAPAWTGAA